MTDDLTEFMLQEAIDESIASTQRIAAQPKSLRPASFAAVRRAYQEL